MEKVFIQKKSKLIKDHGRKLIEVTLDKKSMHYLFESLAKYREFATEKKELDDIDILVTELSKVNDIMNEEEIT